MIVDGVPKFASSTCVISSDDISLFVDDEQTVTAHFEDGSPYSLKVNTEPDQFTLAGGEFASFTTPIAKVNMAPPVVPPPILSKSNKNDRMDGDTSPSYHYNLQRNPLPSRQQYAFPGLKRKQENDSRDSWDDPHFLENLKLSQEKAKGKVKNF